MGGGIRLELMEESTQQARALPRDCSPGAGASEVDQVSLATAAVTIGRFRCSTLHPSFRDTGPIRQAVVVFPRTSVWIQHEGARRFVADPNVVTIYNRGQRYERFPISAAGDDCDWFAVSDAVAREIAGSCDAAAAGDAERPFAHERAQGTAALYARQRSLVARLAAGRVSALEAEETVMAIVADVIRLAQLGRPSRPAAHGEGAERRRDLAEAARAELARSATEKRSVSELAGALGTSPFHLCRVFRDQVGLTMHAYRVGLRVRAAIGALATPSRARTLSQVAHAAGFASHAHFVRICRRELGVTPAVLRERLG